MTAEQILADEFEKLKGLLIDRYDAKKMRASGQWAKELEEKTKGLNASIWGLPYSEQLEDGRTPTSSSPKSGPVTLREAIEDWIEDKNITPKDDISTSSLAFLIARKIHREGWNREKYNGLNLISEVITPAWIQSVIDKVSEFQIAEFSSQVINIYKQLEPR